MYTEQYNVKLGYMMQTKNTIMDTSFTLFVDKGFTDVSINDILQHAKITKGAFYHHFKSKDELIVSVAEKYIFTFFDNMLEQLRTCQICVKEKLILFFEMFSNREAIIHEVCKNNDLQFKHFYFLLMEGQKKYDFISDYRCRFYAQIKEFLVELLEQGKTSCKLKTNFDSHAIALQILASIEGAFFLQLVDEQVEVSKVSSTSFKMIWNSISR